MRPFTYQAVSDSADAILAARADTSAYLAGGTTLLDLMKLDVMAPSHVIDINPLAKDPKTSQIAVDEHGVRFGALVRMSDAANHPTIRRDYPVIAESLSLAASSGLRNMATLGGNLLQRTRCPYFRGTSFAQCNKRNPGSGCAALDGVNRGHAVLGTSEHCIATYPGDFAQALIALDSIIEIQGRDGPRIIPFAQLHVKPGTAPDVETTLRQGDLITAIHVPATSARRSVYLKIRDRQSYEFALASAAVVLDMDGETARRVRIALGGVATVPWRAVEAEAALTGKPITEASAKAAADAAFASATTRAGNAYKVTLGKATLVRAVLQAAEMEA